MSSVLIVLGSVMGQRIVHLGEKPIQRERMWVSHSVLIAPETSINISYPHKELRVSKGVQEYFTPFISRGFVSKAGSDGIEYPVKILRDTVASHSLLRRNSCPQVEDCFYRGEYSD